MTDNDDPFYTIKDAAAYLKLPVQTLYTAIRKKRLFAGYKGRKRFVYRSELERWRDDPTAHLPGRKIGS